MSERQGRNKWAEAPKERQGKNKGGSMGPGGFCMCAKCGEKIKHKQGVKCTTLKCPKCGHTMVREELLNKKKAGKHE